jgi:hypothetical protein
MDIVNGQTLVKIESKVQYWQVRLEPTRILSHYKLVFKRLSGANTLAYFTSPSVTKKKSFMRLLLGLAGKVLARPRSHFGLQQLNREVLPIWKPQCSWPPCTNKLRSVAFYIYNNNLPFLKNKLPLMRRSTVLHLTLPFVFPDWRNSGRTNALSNGAMTNGKTKFSITTLSLTIKNALLSKTALYAELRLCSVLPLRPICWVSFCQLSLCCV